MINLGMHHIREGTDHLLFLLVLLLPAPLVIARKRWGKFGGVRYSFINLIKIVTAFTIGHSITLIAGAMNWFHFPIQPIEVLIAFSILISAIHAWRPIFSGREVYVAAGFGLIHGMAFANTLSNLNLDSGQMALSIFGFNLGIELMQLFVIVLIVPWLIMLSRFRVYSGVRVTGSFLAGTVALAWVIERILEQSNAVTVLVGQSIQYAPWLVLLLVAFALIVSYKERAKISN
jgi:hypothetical protein